MSIRSSEDLAALLHIGSIVGRSLKLIAEHVKPGVKTRDLDAYAGELLKFIVGQGGHRHLFR